MVSAGKRFYRQATAVAEAGGFTVALDGRPIKTPGRAALTLPTEALAAAIAGEWSAQQDRIDPNTMPLSQLAAATIDRVAPARSQSVERVLRYAASDLVCYRAADPADLAERQHAAWQPLLDWLERTWGARLAVTSGIIPIEQPQDAIGALAAAVEGLDDYELTALLDAVQTTDSLVVGLALVFGRIDAETAYRLSQLDETYQIERWGEDELAADRLGALREDIEATARFLALIRGQAANDDGEGTDMQDDGTNAATPEKSVLVRIEGRVQGVCYRYWAVGEANALGLSGWVRNRTDGSVEALFAGPKTAVDAMLEACWQGPPAARVTAIRPRPHESPEQPGFNPLPTL